MKNKKLLFTLIGALILTALFFLNRKQTQIEKPLFFNQSNYPQREDTTPAKGLASETNTATTGSIEKSNANVISDSPINAENLSKAELQQWNAFADILNHKNDNDPRMDTDLKHITPALEKALVAEYGKLVPEKLNERGSIAFLISRDLKKTTDTDFLKSVMQESPCLSLENCNVDAPVDPHHASATNVTLAYPQMVVLYQLEQQLSAHPELLHDDEFKNHIREIFNEAKNNRNPLVSKKAEAVWDRIKF